MLELCLSMLEGEVDKALFLRFHARYEKKLYAVAMTILSSPEQSEDAVQEAMVRIASHFDDFKKIYQKNRQEIGPWCVTIVKHISLDILRKEGREVPLSEDWEVPVPDTTQAESAYQRLVELIRSMPETYREALELRFVLEYSNKEVARALGLTENTAAARISRGRRLLIQRLREEGYELGSV